jgi:hypothetical protein
MNARPTILCPIDFSDACRDALCYARLIAEHWKGRLILLAVEDPLSAGHVRRTRSPR